MESQTAVGQLPEIIYLEGALYSLYTTPLAPWLLQQTPPCVFDRRTSNCERGYIGKWSVEDNMLKLIGIYGWRDGKYTGLPDLFDGQREVLADWFTGPLVIQPTTEAVRAGEYPKSTTINIEAGLVTPPTH